MTQCWIRCKAQDNYVPHRTPINTMLQIYWYRHVICFKTCWCDFDWLPVLATQCFANRNPLINVCHYLKYICANLSRVALPGRLGSPSLSSPSSLLSSVLSSSGTGSLKLTAILCRTMHAMITWHALAGSYLWNTNQIKYFYLKSPLQRKTLAQG